MIKNYTLVFIMVCFHTVLIHSQNIIGRWYNLELQPISSGINLRTSHNASFNEISKLTGIRNEIKNINISKTTLSRFVEGKHDLYGIRGKLNDKEILILDTDLDNKFDDETILELPDIKMNPKIPYNTFYNYPSDFSYYFDTKYEILKDSCIYSLPTKLKISVYAKYDSINDRLIYLDNFRAGIAQKCILKDIIDEHDVTIEFIDIESWVSDIRHTKFTMNIDSSNVRKQLLADTDFKIYNNGKIFRIDSFDILNKRLLIKEMKSYNNYINIKGESLFSKDTISTKSDYSKKVIHVWGPWCRSCLQNIPKIIDLKKEFPEIEFIGLCIADDKDRSIEISKKNNIKWKNIFYSFADFKTQGINIMQYPTYFLVDKNNKVLGTFGDIENLKKEILEYQKR